MLLDFQQWDGPATVDCDVCIIGAGAAGITLALGLAATAHDVYLIEGGGLEPEADGQALFEGASVGRQQANPGYCRLRYLGGTTNHWQGWCAPLTAADFAARPWVPLSGWPIGAAELEPYYPHAARLCELTVDPGAGDVPDLVAGPSDQVEPSHWRLSAPTRFGKVYRDDLRSAANVRVLLHANAERLETAADGSAVLALHARSLSGRRLRVAARNFVLACGGLENARFLLLNDAVEPGGLGNRSGLVGRCFLQHIEVEAGRVVSSVAGELARAFAWHEVGVGPVRFHWRAKPAVHQAERTLNWGAAINAQYQHSAGYTAARHLWSDLGHGARPGDLGHDVGALLADLGGLARELYDADSLPAALSLKLFGEQAPDPDSRVTLCDDRDALGLRRLRVDWRLSDLDHRSLLAAARCVGAELGRRGLGRLQLADWLREGTWPEPIWSGCHHMGTTRMADDPTRGVVDRNCRMHTVRNLFVAGSSVFPTGGYVPPTLTIVALAARLAEHLRRDPGAGATA